MMRCQGYQFRTGCLLTFKDADGRLWYLCPLCEPKARAERKEVLEARQRARDAREQERAGQTILEGTESPQAAPDGPLRLL